jgi:hypothetical protein
MPRSLGIAAFRLGTGILPTLNSVAFISPRGICCFSWQIGLILGLEISTRHGPALRCLARFIESRLPLNSVNSQSPISLRDISSLDSTVRRRMRIDRERPHLHPGIRMSQRQPNIFGGEDRAASLCAPVLICLSNLNR